MTSQANIGKLRLAGFVIVSACVHVLLLSFQDSPQRLELGNARQDFISVQLQNNPVVKTHTPIHHKPDSKPKLATANIAKDPQAQPSKPSTPPAGKAASASSNINRQQIMGRLHQDLARFFYYPPQALRRGWEGKALIHLRLLPDGKIDSISLADSSGHEILDRAAIDSVHRVRQLAMSDVDLHSPLEILLPVIYRLRGG